MAVKKTVNLLLIGLGPHAQRCFYPAFEKYGRAWGFRIVCGVDLESKKSDIERYFSTREWIPEIYFKNLSEASNEGLNHLVKKHKVDGVIIASEPTSHNSYAKWALKKGLNILLDKPISARKNASISIIEARGILEDYQELLKLYESAKLKNPELIFSVLSQRRYHGGILKMKGLIQEVFSKTNCPITAIQINHSDGQWRMPNEIIDIDYHGFNRSIGKCSHSGYHFFDIVSFLIDSAKKKGGEINNVDVISNFIRPNDLIGQLNYRDYSKIFPDFKNHCKYSESEYMEKTRCFGEIDAFISLGFKHDSKTVTLGTINLLHNSFSQRGWLSSVGRELYKGNGRVGHESYQINQGPFQTIYYSAYKGQGNNSFEIGGEYHVDIHVFRNGQMFPLRESYQHFKGEELDLDFPENDLSGAQEGARRKCIKEFVGFIHGKINRQDLKSELPSHKRSATLMSVVYQSAAKRFYNKNPLINIPFHE